MATDFRPEPDEDHPVRWSSMSGNEPDRWISISDAVERLTRDGGDPKSVEVALMGGQLLRTMFATYQWPGVRVDADPGSLAGRLLGL